MKLYLDKSNRFAANDHAENVRKTENNVNW